LIAHTVYHEYYSTDQMSGVSVVTEEKNKSVASLFKSLFGVRVSLAEKCLYLWFLDLKPNDQ